MGSTRLSGKVLERIGSRTMLGRVVSRLQAAKTITRIVVATTDKAADEPVCEEARALGVEAFRGDEDDVLDRYYRAAMSVGAEVIVRVTADCPLIEPEIVDRVVAELLAHPEADVATNVLHRRFPRGLDTEVVSRPALQRAWREARQPYHRAHLFPYFYERPDRFRLLSIIGEQDYSWMRWTVDTAEDLEFVRAIYEQLGDEALISWRAVLKLLEERPELLEINRDVRQKAAREG